MHLFSFENFKIPFGKLQHFSQIAHNFEKWLRQFLNAIEPFKPSLMISIPFAPFLSLIKKNHVKFLFETHIGLNPSARKTMNYLNLETIDISLVVRIGIVDKSVCKCNNMCVKGNSGFEKKKFVLLIRKKGKKVNWKKKRMKKKKRKKYRKKKKWQ